MQFSTLALTAATAATGAFAAPAPQAGTPNPDIVIFSVRSIHSGSDVQNTPWNAMNKSIFTRMDWQDASCDKGANPGQATFQLNKAEGTLSLYTRGAPYQQLFVDRSGMGQGVMLYTTGVEPTPRNAERDGWAIDEATNHLTFGGSDAFLACPGHALGSYRVLPYVGVENPAGYSNCTSIAAQVHVEAEPIACQYSAN